MATEAMIKRMAQLEEIRDEAIVEFELSKEQIKDIEISEIDLDGESLRTPILYNKYLVKYSSLLEKLDRFNNVKNKLYLERWKYYQGKQKNSYYAEYGVLNEVILKSDVEVYLRADELLCSVNDTYNIIKQHIGYIEKIMKEISNRGFHIKTAVEWRKFQMGGN